MSAPSTTLCQLAGWRRAWLVELDLPDAVVKEARANGLLESKSLTDLVAAELRRRKAAAELNPVLDEIRAQTGQPMSMACG